MSLFDRRTDTEKELDAYRNSHPTNERQSPFDKYKNTESTQNNTQSDRYNYGNENYNNNTENTQNNTQSDPYNYSNENYNNTVQNTNNNINTPNTYRNTYTNTKSDNKKHTAANIIIAILVVLLIGSFAGMFVVVNTGSGGLTLAMFGQVFFLFGIIGFISNLKSGKKSIVSFLGVLIFSLVGLFIAVSGFINEFADGQTMESLGNFLSGKLIGILLCSVFIIVGAVISISANVKRSRKRNNCNVPVMAEIIDVKISTSRSNGHTTRHYAPVYRYYYGGTEYIKESDVYLNRRIMTGVQTEILINPNDANDIYEPQRMLAYTNSSTVIGVLFVIMGIVALIFAIR